MHSSRGGSLLLALAAVLAAAPAFAEDALVCDLLFAGGRVVDGTGAPWFRGDVCVVGDRIGQPPEILSSAYEAAIRAYAPGDREKAVSEAGRWPESIVSEQVRALGAVWREARACHICPAALVLRRAPMTAALMLHTDSGQRRRRDGLPAQHHESAALAIARMLKDDPLDRTFARRWYEAAAGLALGETRWDDALTRADEGLREFRDSAEMLLVVGSIDETFGALALLRLPGSVFSPVQGETRANLEAMLIGLTATRPSRLNHRVSR